MRERAIIELLWGEDLSKKKGGDHSPPFSTAYAIA